MMERPPGDNPPPEMTGQQDWMKGPERDVVAATYRLWQEVDQFTAGCDEWVDMPQITGFVHNWRLVQDPSTGHWWRRYMWRDPYGVPIECVQVYERGYVMAQRLLVAPPGFERTWAVDLRVNYMPSGVTGRYSHADKRHLIYEVQHRVFEFAKGMIDSEYRQSPVELDQSEFATLGEALGAMNELIQRYYAEPEVWTPLTQREREEAEQEVAERRERILRDALEHQRLEAAYTPPEPQTVDEAAREFEDAVERAQIGQQPVAQIGQQGVGQRIGDLAFLFAPPSAWVVRAYMATLALVVAMIALAAAYRGVVEAWCWLGRWAAGA